MATATRPTRHLPGPPLLDVLAFESEATDLVAGDTNGVKDIFMIRRAGRADNEGSEWEPGATQLVSKGLGGAPANGPSWRAAIDGGFPEPGENPTYPEVHRLPLRREQPRRAATPTA